MPAKCIMVQGTSSNVGKSLLVAGLCRLLYRRGLRVAPFKSQNMALNSYVTADGFEIGRAQGIQAEAAGTRAAAEMNPILLKPKENMTAQVIVMGRPYDDMSARSYREAFVPRALEIVKEALWKLRSEYQVIVIEGAGSPAEVNLRERDIANMEIALLAGAPVLLVADIDRGGAFASLIGTMELLAPRERSLVSGFIINKFRGDLGLLKPGLDFLEKRTGLPVLGVVPFIKDHGIEEEDSVALMDRKEEKGIEGRIEGLLDIAVIRVPHISNYTDFAPLEAEADVKLRYPDRPAKLGTPDAVILPGSENTTADMHFLYSSGLADYILELHAGGVPVMGICGGFQMLGEELSDPEGIESSNHAGIKGLGLLPVSTVFDSRKITRQVGARVSPHSAWGEMAGLELEGYEIRYGKSRMRKDLPSIVALVGEKEELIGLVSPEGDVIGTYLHDLFYNDLFRRRWLNTLRARRGLPPLPEGESSLNMRQRREGSYDRLASVLSEHLDLERLYQLIGIGKNS